MKTVTHFNASHLHLFDFVTLWRVLSLIQTYCSFLGVASCAILIKAYWHDGAMVRVSASQLVDLGYISQVES